MRSDALGENVRRGNACVALFDRLPGSLFLPPRRVVERAERLPKLNQHPVGALGRDEGVDVGGVFEVLVHHAHASLLKRNRLLFEVWRLQGDVMDAFAPPFEELGEEAVRLDGFQEFNAEVVQVQDGHPEAARVVADAAQLGAEHVLEERARLVDAVNGNADVVKAAKGFVRHGVFSLALAWKPIIPTQAQA